MVQPLARSPGLCWRHSPPAAVGADILWVHELWFGSRRWELLGRSPGCMVQPEDGHSKGWGQLDACQGQAGWASPLKLESRMGCHSSILRKLGQGQNWSVCVVADGSVFLQADESKFFQPAELTISPKMLCQHFLALLSKPFQLLSQHSLHCLSPRPLHRRQGAPQRAEKPPVVVLGSTRIDSEGLPQQLSSQPARRVPHMKAPRVPAAHRDRAEGRTRGGVGGPVSTTSAPPGTQVGGERRGNASEKLGGLCKVLLGTGSFLLFFLMYLFQIKADEVELQERCKSLTGESFFRALPDGSFHYENIAAGSRHRKFPSGRADWMERKTPPSSDVCSEKGQIPGIFPS